MDTEDYCAESETAPKDGDCSALYCRVCYAEFKSSTRLRSHEALHRGVRYQCLQCEARFCLEAQLCQHQHTTSHCGQGIVDGVDNRAWDSWQAEGESDAVTPPRLRWPCRLCGRSFSSQCRLHKHTGVKHPGHVTASATKDPDHVTASATKDPDHVTAGVAKDPDHVTAGGANDHDHVTSNGTIQDDDHSDIITATRVSGDICTMDVETNTSNVAPDSADLNECRRRRLHVCDLCGQLYTTRHLLRHHLYVHTNNRRFKCTQCVCTFKTSSALHKHTNIHTRAKLYTCHQCARSFVHCSSFTRHMRAHRGEKAFACDLCGQRFSQSGGLQQHWRVHSGERPFSCVVCAATFATGSQCRVHMASRHNDRSSRGVGE